MTMALLLMLAFCGPANILAMSITTTTTETVKKEAETPVVTLNRLTNETAMEVFKKSSEIMNVTGADSVLMKLDSIAPRSADTPAGDDGLMLLVMKKPNTTANDTLMERFNAFYITMQQREPAAGTPNSAISAMWGVVMDSARDYVWKRIKTLQELFQTFTPALARPGGMSSGAPSGRSPLGAPTIVEPRVFFLIPEPMAVPAVLDSPDIAADKVTETKSTTGEAAPTTKPEEQVIVPSVTKTAQLLPGTIKDPKAILNLMHPLRYLIRPIGAFSGMNVHTADRTFTSVGTMITHTGLHLSLIGRII